MSSTGLFEHLGYSDIQRMMMFYFICIPLRLSFPFILTLIGKKINVKPFIVLIGLISILQNYITMNSGTWWHRKAHIITGVALVMSTRLDGNMYSSVVLFMDVLYGIISSLIIRPF